MGVVILEQVLMHIHNWFQVGIQTGTYTIRDGTITLPFLQDGQYFRIAGSVFNDGLHRYGSDIETLTDETFDGAIWTLAIPRSLLDIAGEISRWQEKYGEQAASPYLSESFGGYQYSKGTPGGQSGASSWQTAFRSRLNPYRKLREL